MSKSDTFQRWRALIEKNRGTQVLQELHATANDSKKLREVILLHARTRDLQEKIITGVVGPAQEHKIADGIRADLLDLVDKLENGEQQDPQLAQEWASVNIHGDVRNVAINSTLHAQQIHIGDRTVIHQAPREIGKYLTQSPFVPELFVGREVALAHLQQMVNDRGKSVVTIACGEGGIGKSSLAATYCHRFANQYDHLAWLFVDASIGKALLQLAPALNVTFSAADQDEEDMLRHVLLALTNLEGNCLLVLDNVNDHEDLAAHFHYLASLPNFRVLITSRLGDFPSANICVVEALEREAARELFVQRYRALTAEEATLFPDIYAAVGGNTLVLELLAKNLKRVNALRPDKYLLSDLLLDLQQKGILGLRESKSVATQYGGKLQQAEAGTIVAAMYELETLTEAELFLLTLFSVLPADKIPFAHLELLTPNLEDIEDPLLSLTTRGWVEWDREEGSFRCSPVVQEVVRVRRERWVDELRPAFAALNQQFLTHSGVHFFDHSQETIAP
ncbi:MAG: NB-ARC domain-containing protein, partial [Bacteroidota bacterium]